jgi:hypothetical protein
MAMRRKARHSSISESQAVAQFMPERWRMSGSLASCILSAIRFRSAQRTWHGQTCWVLCSTEDQSFTNQGCPMI